MMVHVAKALNMDGHDKIIYTATDIHMLSHSEAPKILYRYFYFERKASGPIRTVPKWGYGLKSC
jgi:hypothetical protein